MKRSISESPLPAETLRAAVKWAVTSRRSVRAYLPTPVGRETIESILDLARYAATGVNMQPWRVHVLVGKAKERVCRAIRRVRDDPALDQTFTEEWPYYPSEWRAPYLDRRRKVGWDLYGLIGIDKSDKARMHAQHGRNYDFFDAPVGLFFTLDRVMQQGSLIDYGMFLQTIMVVARTYGLSTCPQAAFMKYHRIIAEELALAPDEMFVCGMSLGYADTSRIENALVTEREEVAAFTAFHSE
jgi:nitroreductase